MTANGWFQILFFLLMIFLITKPVGVFLTRVFNGETTFLDLVLRPIEKLVYRLTGVDEQREMRWTEYTVAMLLFSGVSMTLLYLIERTQKWLPFNPQTLPNVEPGLAFGTAASFTTNTNWQAYVPETTMSYLTQMAGLAYHNFVSAAVGIVLAIVPICLAGSLVFVSQGVVQNFWALTSVLAPFNPAETWKEKRCVLESPIPPCLPLSQRMPVAARPTACTIPSRRLVAWFL